MGRIRRVGSPNRNSRSPRRSRPTRWDRRTPNFRRRRRDRSVRGNWQTWFFLAKISFLFRLKEFATCGFSKRLSAAGSFLIQVQVTCSLPDPHPQRRAPSSVLFRPASPARRNTSRSHRRPSTRMKHWEAHEPFRVDSRLPQTTNPLCRPYPSYRAGVWHATLLLYSRFPVQHHRHRMCRAIVVVGIDEEALAVAAYVVDDHFGGGDPLTGIGLEENRRRARLKFGFSVDGSHHQFRVG